MKAQRNNFTVLITGEADNDTAALRYIQGHEAYREAKCVLYQLEYVPPYYETFKGIRDFQELTKYHAFHDPIQKEAAAVIDLSEWIGHEQESYLEIFCKFLHDYDWAFYQYVYIFTVGEADRKTAEKLYALLDRYLEEGEIVEMENRTLSNGEHHAYQTSWEKYAQKREENRFLSSSEEDLLKICDCIDLHGGSHQKTSGGIPIHYDKEKGKIYVLKTGPHTRVEGESGSKKSRTIARGSIISACLNHHNSVIVTDPKGEISSDPKIQWILQRAGVRTHILDFRTFDKDGVNPLAHAFEMLERGKWTEGMSSINKFVTMIVEKKKGADDPFWNTQAGDLIRFGTQILAIALLQKKDGKKAFNLSSVKSFIRQDRERLQSIFFTLAQKEPGCNAIKGYNDVIQIDAEKTYSCIVSSANALLSEFASSEQLLQMLSRQTFDIRSFYERPSALFLIIPDEHKTYNMIAGYLIDQFYQILVETYAEQFQNQKEAPCGIKFICDEAANLQIHDMASKISASRSRQIDWTLIFQSERQMKQAYPEDWGTICGNCRNKIYLGTSDFEIQKNISAQAGTDFQNEPLVSAADLRKMKKEKEFKEALILCGNYLYCAKLPDYEALPFPKKLEGMGKKKEKKTEQLQPPVLYTPEDLMEDYRNGKICFSQKRKQEIRKPKVQINYSEDGTIDNIDIALENELNEVFDSLFGED